MMFHGRRIRDNIIELSEKTVRLVYDNTAMPFEDLLTKGKTLMIHHQNVHSR